MLALIQKYADAESAVKLAMSIERMVREKRLQAGGVLPPVRQLADALGISPGTAAAAYKTLRERGVASGDRRRGTRLLGEAMEREYRDRPVTAGEHDLRVANPDPALLLDLRPIFASIDAAPGHYNEDHVSTELAAAARRMFEADGVDAEHLFVAGGAIGALQRALRATVSFGDKVAVEDPGFNDHHALVTSVGCTTVPVAVDDEGPLPDSLAAAIAGGVRAVLLTARCQSPTGATITRARALRLRDVLRRAPEVAVLLDDYGALLDDKPYANIVSHNTQWCVVRSFNKVISPDLRVAVAVGDAQTIARMHQHLWLGDGWVSPYLQRACATALKQHKHLTRASRVYAERRGALLTALADHGIKAHGSSGLNVWVPVDDETTIVTGLAAQGWHVRAGARYRLQSPPAVRITAARLLPREAVHVARALAAITKRDTAHAP